MPVSDQIDIIKEVFDRLEQNLRGSIAHDALLRRINEQPDIIPTFNNTVEGHGFGVVQHGLIELFILGLTRCYDQRASNRASLPHLIELLKNPAAVDRLALDAREWISNGMLADANERNA